jgi:hypothetical protein
VIPFFDIGLKLIDKLIPDPQAKQAANLRLLELQQAGEFKQMDNELAGQLAQIEVNKVEAASPNPFVSGWRPGAGWICVAGLGYTFLGQPLLTYFAVMYGHPAAPKIDTAELMLLLGGMLGLGGLRSAEKFRGVARD